MAVENGDLDRVRELIASGEDPNPHTVSECDTCIYNWMLIRGLRYLLCVFL